MPIVERKSVLSGLTVLDAMRRIAAQLPKDAPIEEAAKTVIKFRVNSLLITDEKHEPVGVVSKTNIMGGYYAGIPIETPLEAIMMPSPLFCEPGDTLESALDLMRTHNVHRLFVKESAPDQVVGVLAYYDICGLLYRYCHKCERNILRTREADSEGFLAEPFHVYEVMTPSVFVNRENESLMEVMEGLEANNVGAILIIDENGLPAGVVSKTDLIIAYKHGISAEVPAKTIMSTPVRSCDEREHLVLAIQRMIFADVQRLFVHKEDPGKIVGVLSLSDAARTRSGSCRACISSRIEVENAPD
jgi:predicted transcriptional regulator